MCPSIEALLSTVFPSHFITTANTQLIFVSASREFYYIASSWMHIIRWRTGSVPRVSRERQGWALARPANCLQWEASSSPIASRTKFQAPTLTEVGGGKVQYGTGYRDRPCPFSSAATAPEGPSVNRAFFRSLGSLSGTVESGACASSRARAHRVLPDGPYRLYRS